VRDGESDRERVEEGGEEGDGDRWIVERAMEKVSIPSCS
jgi:hypothetical protein